MLLSLRRAAAFSLGEFYSDKEKLALFMLSLIFSDMIFQDFLLCDYKNQLLGENSKTLV